MSDRIKKHMEIKEFDMRSFKRNKNPAIVIIAKRGSGKSFICRDILNYLRDIPVGIIISRTEDEDPFYSTFFPDSYIYSEFKHEIIERLIYRQSEMKEKKKRYKKLGKKIDTRAFIIMDDCLADKKDWANDPNMKRLLYNGRHLDITYILTMQYPLGITPDLRTNFDYVFLLADDNYTNQEKMFKHYAGVFHKFQAFQEIYNQLTQNFGCLVLCNRGARYDFFDKVFWYKAKEIIPPKICCEQFLTFHEKNYDENWRKRKKDFDVETYIKSRGKEPLKVEKGSKDGKTKKRKTSL